jgi:hypothetical protein
MPSYFIQFLVRNKEGREETVMVFDIFEEAEARQKAQKFAAEDYGGEWEVVGVLASGNVLNH